MNRDNAEAKRFLLAIVQLQSFRTLEAASLFRPPHGSACAGLFDRPDTKAFAKRVPVSLCDAENFYKTL
jgi:hypothetical protein